MPTGQEPAGTDGSPGPAPLVAVIGAGSSGLPTIKSCLEEGLRVVCFERTAGVGGLWRYTDPPVDGCGSVARNTMLNSSKEFSAYSDFPPPAECPNFMLHSGMLEYLTRYATHFGLDKHIRFNHMIQAVRRESPGDGNNEGGRRWTVSGRDTAAGKDFAVVADAVVVCSGHHAVPRWPQVPGLRDTFRGRVVHAHDYRKPSPFEDRRVLVIGMGNSGGDMAVELSYVCSQVYLSTRRGTWMAPRLAPDGRPMDVTMCTRAAFDHADLRQRVPSRRRLCRVRGWHSGRGDDIIVGTGYVKQVPFLPEEVACSVREGRVELYKFIFPVEDSSVAFVGIVEPIGGFWPVAEMQSRYVARVLAGRLALPDVDKQRDEATKRASHLPIKSDRYASQVYWIAYMDELASLIGAKPNLKRMAVTDPVLYRHCVFGPCLPYQFRLEGPHSWEGARRAILDFPKRMAPVHAPPTLSEQGRVRGAISINMDVALTCAVVIALAELKLRDLPPTRRRDHVAPVIHAAQESPRYGRAAAADVAVPRSAMEQQQQRSVTDITGIQRSWRTVARIETCDYCRSASMATAVAAFHAFERWR
ncbi:hypothetical protein HPB48_011319 [Haemaphysalis longicornis]|uniref:Flavin-containing monooxygenase n=1 Tax=Haemaphysalis longicornis TaxID=44386 RepID=A0A9J6GAR8_HAELO|nr:hypothetical protein HPB48_011319 [Haemaphysalis longicornis]